MAAHEDEAVEVVEGAKVDGAAVAGQIVAWIDRRSALRRLRREHLSRTRWISTVAPDDVMEPGNSRRRYFVVPGLNNCAAILGYDMVISNMAQSDSRSDATKKKRPDAATA